MNLPGSEVGAFASSPVRGLRDPEFPIWPPSRPAMPISMAGVMPASRTFQMSMPVGVPRYFRNGMWKSVFSPTVIL